MVPRRSAILGLAALALPLGAEARRKKKRPVAAESVTGLSVVTHVDEDYTIGSEDISILDVSAGAGVTRFVTLPDPTVNGGRVVFFTTYGYQGGGRLVGLREGNISRHGAVLACDGVGWYLVADF